LANVKSFHVVGIFKLVKFGLDLSLSHFLSVVQSPILGREMREGEKPYAIAKA